MLRATIAQPEDRRAHIGRHAHLERHADRILGPGRGEDFFLAIVIAHRPLKERALDLTVRLGGSLGDGGGEVGMVAAPMGDGVGGHFEDVGDVFQAEAVAA